MIQGVLNVYKEKGYTSHDVVAKLRGILGQKKIGHTGTLDPEAEGVLPVCLGKATKACGLLTDAGKTYETVLLLGQKTDTQDISGRILSVEDPSQLRTEEVEEAVFSFLGDYDQIPPMYSARKVNGKRLYQLAREGKTVQRPARTVQIHKIEILKMQLPRVTILVDCSKGTYIRTLCNDIGDRLGCGGCMESLIRTRVGPFGIGQSVRLSEIEEKIRAGELEQILTPTDALFPDYPQVVVQKEGEPLAHNGNRLPAGMVERLPGWTGDCKDVRVYDSTGAFIALYRYDETGQEYRVVKMFDQKE